MMSTINDVLESADAARVSMRKNDGGDNGDLICESISSSSSYDYDDPYHETAAQWFQRHSRLRARRMCGMSSSDSDDSNETITDESEKSDDDVEDSTEVISQNLRLRKGPEKDLLAPLIKNWLRSYPSISARCCFSVPCINHTTGDYLYSRRDVRSSHGHDNVCQSPRLTRSEETKRLRRIIRRIRRKECDLRMTSQQRDKASEPITDDHNSNEPVDIDRVAVDSFLPRGTGISFIDVVIARDSILTSNLSHSKFSHGKISPGSNLVLEVNGPSRSGKSTILLSLAARYLACTSSFFMNPFGASCISSDLYHQNKRQKLDRFVTLDCVDEPKVVALDLEHGISSDKLTLTVKEAVIRRWEESSAARQWMAKHQAIWSKRNKCMENRMDGDSGLSNSNCDYTVSEQQQIDKAIAYCLGRIHIIQPRDFTYLNLVASLESLRQSLENDQIRSKNIRNKLLPVESPPTLLLIDSLTTLDEFTRFQESLPTSHSSSNMSRGSGLSEKNEFYRQLIRLREEHNVMIAAASKNILGSSVIYDGVRGDKESRGHRPGGTAWEKLLTHRVALHHVAEGTLEDRNGYEFVATLRENDKNGDIHVFPYAVTAGRICC